MAAFDLGIAAGADGLELDVHLSADGVLVVHHDDMLDRTTNATGPLAKLTAAELARVDAGYRFAGRGDFPFRNRGIGIPALRDVLPRYPDVRIIIEMKVDTREMGEAVMREVRTAGAAERVCLGGFGRRSAATVRAGMPEVVTSACAREVHLAVYRSWVRWPVTHVPYQAYQVPEKYRGLRVVSPRWLCESHDAGLKVQVWTVDAEPDMRRLLAWGVDGLISNRPDLAVQVRDAVA